MHTVIRVLGTRTRIFRGTEQRDRLKVIGGGIAGEKELKGYVKTTRIDGQVIVTTHYKDQQVAGYDAVWLAARNSMKLKIAAPVAMAA